MLDAAYQEQNSTTKRISKEDEDTNSSELQVLQLYQ